MESFKVCLFADQQVGLETLSHLIQYYPNDLQLVVSTGNFEPIENLLNQINFPKANRFHAQKHAEGPLQDFLHRHNPCHWSILAWWPFLIKKETIHWPLSGTLNFHPSLLPHNRGKHYNFWTLVEDSPFGVSIHQVTEGIDDGALFFQKPIAKTWEDTGETLYHKARKAMVELFTESYPKLRSGAFHPLPQNLNEGSFRWGHEMEKHSTLHLDKNYTARQLLNLIRARTFPPHPAIRFEDQGQWFQVRVSIEPIDPPSNQ